MLQLVSLRYNHSPQAGSANSDGHQLKYVEIKEEPLKILAWTAIDFFTSTEWGTGRDPFIHFKCPITNCIWTKNRSDFPTADAVILHMLWFNPAQQKALFSKTRPSGQKWIAYMRESQIRISKNVKTLTGLINVTMGFRDGMDIP